MTRTAVVMAGGRSERMARSGVACPKVLVRVAGIPLLEWNLGMVTRSGVDRVLVSVAARDRDVRAVVGGWSAERVTGSRPVSVEELVEERPLGNIGAAGLLSGSVDSLLVVFGDNLTGIDLHQLYDDHLSGGADLTLAAHRVAWRMPFGELIADPDDPTRLVEYVEKPTYGPLVASGLMVLGRRARRGGGEQLTARHLGVVADPGR